MLLVMWILVYSSNPTFSLHNNKLNKIERWNRRKAPTWQYSNYVYVCVILEKKSSFLSSFFISANNFSDKTSQEGAYYDSGKVGWSFSKLYAFGD